ncbi:MAG TPA: hypothetical protein VGH54_28135 [Mycobacterium sp.]|jgi:hypothetical protein|uniref:hypothetical protein n=1 Tax=Mycobacterium sp. TaxID=1785 RepID=UPI002F41478A
MAAPGVVAGGTGTGTPAGGGGMNPFWEVTNLFSQKNKIGNVTNYLMAGSTNTAFAGTINSGNYIRGMRVQVRTSTAPVGAFTAPTGGNDHGFQLFSAMGIQNTDGAEILFDVINGYAYWARHKYFRPWLQDPLAAYDFVAPATAIGPSYTLFLNPEVRQQMGCLENTDTRSQYTYSTTIAATGTANGQFGSYATTQATISVLGYTDMWAQPDASDLENVPNQRIPPGVNLQTKTRHQIFVLGTTGNDNNFLSTLTGNALRGQLWICRDGTGTRQDALTEPLTWTQDSRNLGNLSPDQVFRWMQDMYNSYGQSARDTGVYMLPRFYDPGDMKGQGWLYTANSTALNLESVSQNVSSVGTTELVQEEVYAVGPVDPTLIDL